MVTAIWTGLLRSMDLRYCTFIKYYIVNCKQAPPTVNTATPTVNSAPPTVNMAPPTLNWAPPTVNTAPPTVNTAPYPRVCAHHYLFNDPIMSYLILYYNI